MSFKIMRWEWFVEISDQEQELLSGGNQPQISNNNFSQKTANTTQTNNSGRLGNISQTNTDFADVNSGAKSMLSSDVIGVSPLRSVNNLMTPNSSQSFNSIAGF